MKSVLEHEIYLKLPCQCNLKFSSAHLRDLSTFLQHETQETNPHTAVYQLR
jgi:hypothetical protein